MIPIYSYTDLPYDLSGSRSKNRFRIELLWGLEKMINFHKANINYTMVFDYACDIEAHLDGNNFEFYQLKTQNTGEPYNYINFYNKGKKKNSILGKLYLLKLDINKVFYPNIKTFLVSNVPLSVEKNIYPDIEVLELTHIDDEAKLKIISKLNHELDINLEDLSNTFFQKTDINLLEPSFTLIGKLSRFFEDYFGFEAHKINALYNTIFNLINEKASYEYDLGNDYDKILMHKSISRNDFERILLSSKKLESSNHIETTKKYIEEISNSILERTKLKRSLTSAITLLKELKEYTSLEKEIHNFLINNLDSLPNSEAELFNFLFEQFKQRKTIETDDKVFLCMIILIFCSYEEGTCLA